MSVPNSPTRDKGLILPSAPLCLASRTQAAAISRGGPDISLDRQANHGLPSVSARCRGAGGGVREGSSQSLCPPTTFPSSLPHP